MTTKKKSTAWVTDGDDAHFVSAKKHHGKKRVANNLSGRKAKTVVKKTAKRVVTKR